MKESDEFRPVPFPYLRITVTDTNSSDLEVEREIQAATNVFGGLLYQIKKCTMPLYSRLYSAAVQLNARQEGEADKSTITPSL